MKLWVKIGLILAAVAIPSAITAFVLVYSLLRNEIVIPMQNDQLNTSEQTIARVDHFLQERLVGLGVVGEATILTDLVATPNGTTKSEAEDFLNEVVKTSSNWNEFAVVDNNKSIVASSKNAGFDVGEILTDNASVIDKALKGGLAFSDEFTTSSGQTMLFAAPINDTDAILVGLLKWDSVVDIISDSQTYSANIYNSEKTLIATDTDVILPFSTGEDIVEQDVTGEKFILTYAPELGYKEFTGNGWTIALGRPAVGIYSVAERLPRTMIVSLSISTVLVIILFTAFVARLLKPVETMTNTANKIALGDLTQRVKFSGSGDFASLAKAFNNMADRLQQIYKNLEAKVVERTTQLAQQVDEVEKARAKDEAILSSIGEGMIAVNADGTVALINDIAIKMINVDEKSAIDKQITDLLELTTLTGVPVTEVDSPISLALRTGRLSDGVFKLRSDKEKRQIAIVSNPIFQDRKIIGAIMILRDVTKEREVDRMKTEFISLASHQLRTPLSAIKWFSEMLLSGDAGKMTIEQTEFSKNIYESTERMIELVNSLLNISRIESGRIIVDPKPTDLKDLIKGIVKDLQTKIEQKEINLVVSVHEGLGLINLDPRLISQVYLNFLTNAIKYTPRGGEISIFISRKGDFIVSQIADTGYGIPKSQQDRVFKKFFRGENVVKVETEGTGLGLYLVKAIIESSGGRVWFKSEEGKGSSFWFSLPITGMKPKSGEVTLDS